MKSKTTAGLLALFLGGWGSHHFYLGNNKKGVTYLLVTIFGLGVGAMVIGVMSIIDAISYFSMSDQEFKALCQRIKNENGQIDNTSSRNSLENEEVDKYQKIKKYKELLDMGAISEEEFNDIKTKILKRENTL